MENFEIIDSNENLKLKCYKNCSNESIDDDKLNRGIIINHENEMIVPSFGYTDIYTLNDQEKLKNLFNDFNQWKFYYSIEGSLLRCFFYKDKWYLSTHRKLNAYESRWSCPFTFGELFENELKKYINDYNNIYDNFFQYLDKNVIYYFLLKSNIDNRIVCNNMTDSNNIIYIGSSIIKQDMNSYFYDSNHVILSLFNQQMNCSNITNYQDLIQMVQSINYDQFQGILAWNINTNRQIKIYNDQYYTLFQLRNNNPNLRFRYLELRLDETKMKNLYQLYPKYNKIFDELEDNIRQVARILHQFYINRYIKNQYITLPREEYNVVKKAHQWHLLNKKDNIVFSQNVLDIINKETPLSLYKMIKRYNMNKKIIK
jgi:hypothetical protein